jgi:hypothetical protein
MPHCILVSARLDQEDVLNDFNIPQDGEVHVVTLEILGRGWMTLGVKSPAPGRIIPELTPLIMVQQWCEAGHPEPENQPTKFDIAHPSVVPLHTGEDAEHNLTTPWDDIDKSSLPGAVWMENVVIYEFVIPMAVEFEFCKHMMDKYGIHFPAHSEVQRMMATRWNVAVGASIGKSNVPDMVEPYLREGLEQDGPGYIVRKPVWDEEVTKFGGVYYGWKILGEMEGNPTDPRFGIRPSSPINYRRTKRQPKRRRR